MTRHGPVVGLRLSSYAIGCMASVVMARGLGPEGRGLYALPIAFLGIVMAVSHVGLEHASVFLKRLRGALWLRAPMDGVRSGRPLRVLLMIGSLNRGGTEGQVLALASGLWAKGHAVTILCLTEAGPLANDPGLANVDVVRGHSEDPGRGPSIGCRSFALIAPSAQPYASVGRTLCTRSCTRLTLLASHWSDWPGLRWWLAPNEACRMRSDRARSYGRGNGSCTGGRMPSCATRTPS